MNKNSKTSSNVKATRQSKDTKKTKILIKASIKASGNVNVSLWDKDFEIGSIICPIESYGLPDSIYAFLDQMLIGYFKSEEFLNNQKKEGRERCI